MTREQAIDEAVRRVAEKGLVHYHSLEGVPFYVEARSINAIRAEYRRIAG